MRNDIDYQKHYKEKETTWVTFLFVALFFYSAPYFLVFGTGFLINQTAKPTKLLYIIFALVLLIIPLFGMNFAIPKSLSDVSPQIIAGWVFAFEFSLIWGLGAGWTFGEIMKPENQFKQIYLFSILIIFVVFGNSPLNYAEQALTTEIALENQRKEVQKIISEKYPSVDIKELKAALEKAKTPNISQ